MRKFWRMNNVNMEMVSLKLLGTTNRRQALPAFPALSYDPRQENILGAQL